jgi:CheY-like chemotaxis protein
MATVLLVDDDPDIRRVLRRLLEQAGHHVVDAESAPAAMSLVLGPEPPDVVVCDVVMPGKNGLVFYADLVELAPTLRNRVIFLTGAAHDRGVHDRIEQLGVPLIAKLDDLQLVVDAVRIALLRS